MRIFFTLIITLTVSLNGFAQNNSAKQNYLDAYSELESMLAGQQPFSFKRAVFITENAFLEGQLNYSEFQKQIDALARLTKAVAESDGLIYTGSDRNQVLLSASVFRVMKDSLSILTNDNRTWTKLPYTYDMQDFWGEKEWTKMFVTKLLYDRTGNCHSLPALYKIIADEVGAKAWLSLAPNHTYIKQWSEKVGWYNTELTTGTFPFDKDIKWNSYIKSESIADGVYMDTLSTREMVSYAMTDLAQGYVRMFGYEDYLVPLAWLDKALEHYPDYVNALILKAEILKKAYEQKMFEGKQTDFRKLVDVKSKIQFAELESAYAKIHEVGYRRMPKEMYLNWLFRVQNDTTRKPFQFQTPQPFKRYNYNVLVITGGNGYNSEFFDEHEVVRIGTVEFNIQSRTITKFVAIQPDDMPDEVISRMYDPALGRWWQVDPMSQERESVSPYNFVQNNPVNRVDPTGALDWVLNGEGEVYWDKNANSQESTKQGETYLGKTVSFEFNSYIDGKLWDGPGGQGPAGDKLTSTVTLTGSENSAGELTGIDATASVKVGDTPLGTARDSFSGLGDDQNKFSAGQVNGAFSLNFEQHASVSPIEQFGLNAMGYDIVNVAQKLNISTSGNKLNVSAATDVFPSATLSVNGNQLMKYDQPSFRATHGRDLRTTTGDNGTGGSYVTESVPRRPAPTFYQRYKK